jgi:hypothetical protein
MTIDLEIYTNTFFGGAFETLTGGTIDSTEPAYCSAISSTANSGSFVITYCNANKDNGGRYTATTQCGLPTIGPVYAPNDELKNKVSVDPIAADNFDLLPGECKRRQYTFAVNGPAEVSEVYCTTTLFSGAAAGAGVALDSVEFGCNITVKQMVSLGKHEIVLTFPEPYCKAFDIFCLLAEAGKTWLSIIVYILMFIMYIAFLAFAYYVFQYWRAKNAAAKTLDEMQKNVIEIREYNKRKKDAKAAKIRKEDNARREKDKQDIMAAIGGAFHDVQGMGRVTYSEGSLTHMIEPESTDADERMRRHLNDYGE